MTEAEKIATNVSRDFAKLKQFVQGNGSKEGCLSERVSILEIRSKKMAERIEGFPCIDGCLYEAHEKTEAEMQIRKRGFRIGDIANYLSLIALLLLVYGMFFQ